MKPLLLPLTEPLGFLWVALVLWGVVLLGRRHGRAAAVALVTAVVLSLVGATRIPTRLLASLERPYAGVTIDRVQPADAVVMLGGILRQSAPEPLGFDLGTPADRVMAALELVRRGKARVLVLGGGGQGPRGGPPAEGELLLRWLNAWGLTNAPIHLLGICKNTRDEAERTLELMRQHRWKRVLLVTSAGHMRRAEAVFRRLSIPVQVVPCDFVGLTTLQYPASPTPLPRIEGFQHLSLYAYEVLGWWLYRLRGWV
ncbi:MAG TPA: YdcF family protein [Verrucomicrobiota bacterium]|nr:YdcF family protein [Verrucomicrobiota bacterium]HNU53323.1 YdcF family protein [Verrucomicrobiota bacterium]